MALTRSEMTAAAHRLHQAEKTRVQIRQLSQAGVHGRRPDLVRAELAHRS